MKIQIILLLILTLAAATGLFTGSQIMSYFRPRNVELASWDVTTRDRYSLDPENFSMGASSLAASVLGLTSEGDGSAPVSSKVVVKSRQGHIFDQYFAANNSPLAGYGDHFVTACRKYAAPSDCTLLPAIAKVETNHCRTDISAKQFNCWGFGGSGPNRILYTSFPQAIDEITRRLMSGYGTRFFQNPNNGALSYCGGHCVNWGDHVQSERLRINSFFKSKGHPALF